MDLQPVTAPVEPNVDDNLVDAGLEDVVEGGCGMRMTRYVVEEGNDEEEDKCFPWFGVSGNLRLVVTPQTLLPQR
jgi:hypothetical protein